MKKLIFLRRKLRRYLGINFSYLYWGLTFLSLCLVSIFYFQKFSKKNHYLNLSGAPLVAKQLNILKSIDLQFSRWVAELDKSLLNKSKAQLKINRDLLTREVQELGHNHNALIKYMDLWSIDFNEVSKYRDIAQFFYVNPVHSLPTSFPDLEEEKYFKQKVSLALGVISLYEDVLRQQHAFIIKSKGVVKVTRYLLIIFSIIMGATSAFFLFEEVNTKFFEKNNVVYDEKFCVLFVDDDEDILDVLISNNEKLENCRFLSAKDGLDALEVLKNEHVDLIVTDLSMPRMGGVELISKLNKKEIPIVVMTSKNFLPEDSRKALKNQHVYDKFDILNRMDEVIGRQLELRNVNGVTKKVS